MVEDVDKMPIFVIASGAAGVEKLLKSEDRAGDDVVFVEMSECKGEPRRMREVEEWLGWPAAAASRSRQGTRLNALSESRCVKIMTGLKISASFDILEESSW
jgi:hypothetical protein